MSGQSQVGQLGGHSPSSSDYLYWISGGINALQLDIVGFLAILGEGSVLASSQVATLSRIVYLPRLVPAPQALLKPSRPSKLSPHGGYATSVWSGNFRDYINHVGGVMVDAESLPEYSVRCVEIVRKPRDPSDQVIPGVKAKVFGPLWAVAVFGFFLSCVLFGVSLYKRDGPAMMATILLSFLSTLVGWGNKWTLNLPQRKQTNIWTPQGDVVIRYPKGNFLIVQCVEDVARELYFAPENLVYFVGPAWQYRMISLVGTLMLMSGVIFLGNAQVDSQIAYAGAYMMLNAAYWIVAALPSKLHWDMSCFEIKEQCLEEPNQEGSYSMIGKKYVDCNDTFTQALWKAIVATKSIDWIERSSAAPKTKAWEEWLFEAKERASAASSRIENIDGKDIKIWEVPNWDAQKAMGDFMNAHRDPDKV